MAKSGAVWGIDIGQCALKALRCRPHDSDSSRIVADAFDYVEYPKILSQPEADPQQLVHEALELFLSRNDMSGCRVALSVSGQSGLARFIKLPPVESKKIPDIVKYEAKQQIPFALEDVVWDYQQMAGGSVEEGFALETEVGLFAMKRDQVYRALSPLQELGIRVDFVQLTPLALYNFAVFDRMPDLPSPEDYDPDEPPPSTVVLSIGTDTTDLVVTNGYRVWQRSLPIGGSHFTKALSKELRLTFAKAEQLKRNATQAEDPKLVYKAMRPVFGDLVTEIQRSIGYFTGIDRAARISNVAAMGNPMKLPGLARYLSDHLKHPVTTVQEFRGLDGDAVLGSPQFKENLLSFGVSYGLCLQGLGLAKIRTNLLPQEIVTQRLIREKKPWVVAAAAALLVGCTVNFLGQFSAWRSADTTRQDFTDAIRQAKSVEDQHSRYQQESATALEKFQQVSTIGENLISNVEGRILWLELLRAIDAALPFEPADEKPKKISDRRELHIESLDCERFDDLSTWFQGVRDRYLEDYRSIDRGNPGEAPPAASDGAAAETTAAPAAAAGTEPAAAPATSSGESAGEGGPSGPGWVIELKGYHYYNEDVDARAETFVRETLLRNLHEKSVELPDFGAEQTIEVPLRDLGIAYPVMVSSSRVSDPMPMVDPNAGPAAMMTADRPGPVAAAASVATPPGGGGLPPDRPPGAAPPVQMVRRFDFTVQFSWQPTPPSKRRELASQREQTANGSGGPVASTAPETTGR